MIKICHCSLSSILAYQIFNIGTLGLIVTTVSTFPPFENISIDLITNLLEVSLTMSGSTLRYNTILILVDRLTNIVCLVPYFMGENYLSVT